MTPILSGLACLRKMPSHTIDSVGEVTIILQYANAPFAVWPESATNEHPTAPRLQTRTTVTKKTSETKDITYKVSAKHLTLASPVFAKALSPKWSEGSTLQEKGSVEITVDGWDFGALLILLNIFHCRFNGLPDNVSLELLAKIVILADYYQCLATIRVFTNKWVKGITPPRAYGRDLMLWLLICSLTHRPTSCKELSQIAVKQSRALIPTLGLPFPVSMIERINEKRVKMIGHIIDVLHLHVDHMTRFDTDGISLPMHVAPVDPEVCFGWVL